MVKRKGKALIPNGDLVLHEGDTVILYSQSHVHYSQELHI